MNHLHVLLKWDNLILYGTSDVYVTQSGRTLDHDKGTVLVLACENWVSWIYGCFKFDESAGIFEDFLGRYANTNIFPTAFRL